MACFLAVKGETSRREDGRMDTVRKLDISDTMWEDVRGWGINPLKISGMPDGRLLDLHVVSMRPGSERGNHYHPHAMERMLVCGDHARTVWRSAGGEIHEIQTRSAGPTLLEISPDVEHAVKNESEREIYPVVLCNTSDPETVRCAPLFALRDEGE